MGPGPAGIPLIEYLFSRLVCIAVPLGFIALLVILVIAGIKYLTSGGETKAISQAHQTVTWGLLGVLFLAIAWLILQLIQNFTGVEVTKFTLSSLPGVQGFTGSCWESPPVTPNPTPVPVSQQQTSTVTQPQTKINLDVNVINYNRCKNNIEGFSYSVNICMAQCSDPDEYLVPLRPEKQLSSITYRATGLTELEKVIDKPKVINILEGAVSNSLWEFSDRRGRNEYYLFHATVPTEITDVSRYDRGTGLYVPNKIYAKFQKDMLPRGFIEARHRSQEIAKKLLRSSFPLANLDDYNPVSLTGFSCSDGDYYSIEVVSPLIYLYPPEKQQVSVKVHYPGILTPVPALSKEGTWNVIAESNGLLNSEYNHLYYQFIEMPYIRPIRGFVVDKEHLASYLKEDLWIKLGLTELEIEDYWKDLEGRIPKAPYYFISLVDRSEIDRILPMEVNPKPDTIIRNMTYILPIDKPFIPIPIQIKAPQRKGFTVLENGGFIDGF